MGGFLSGGPVNDPDRPPARSRSSPEPVFAKEWLARFRALYDEEARDPRTALGLFYERHRRFVAGPESEVPNRPEYTYEEWNRAFAAFLGSLARDFGLVQTDDWTNVPQLMWIWHGRPDRPAVAIRESKVAGHALLHEDLPSVVSSGATLTVLVIYPDFPPPEGTESFVEATDRWRDRVAEELSRLGMDREFLLAAISASDWDVPAAWKGFAWHPVEKALKSV